MDINLNLTLEETNLVLAILGKQPYEIVFSVVDKIKGQVGPQIAPLSASKPGRDLAAPA